MAFIGHPSGRSSRMRWRLAAGATASAAVIATAGYYVNEVHAARDDTPKAVARAWQTYGRHVALRDLSIQRLQWLLAVEDPAFFRHHGVDLSTPGAGMTTISQGLVKLLYFPEGFHKGLGKIRQTLIAQYAFDALVTKKEQLELFLNAAYLGHFNGIDVRGFDAAARIYFRKDVVGLSDGEFKSLVAMLAAPDRFAPGSPALADRIKRVDAVLSGAYRPAGVLDTEYDGKVTGTIGEEALMSILRLITDAKPSVPAARSAQSNIPPDLLRQDAEDPASSADR